MGKVRSYNEALEAHRKWKQVQARKKEKEEQKRLKREEEIKKDAERRHRREEKAERKRKEEEERKWNKRLREMRRPDPSHATSGDIYTEEELRNLEQLYPNEVGRLTERYWEIIDELKSKTLFSQ